MSNGSLDSPLNCYCFCANFVNGETCINSTNLAYWVFLFLQLYISCEFSSDGQIFGSGFSET